MGHCLKADFAHELRHSVVAVKASLLVEKIVNPWAATALLAFGKGLLNLAIELLGVLLSGTGHSFPPRKIGAARHLETLDQFLDTVVPSLIANPVIAGGYVFQEKMIKAFLGSPYPLEGWQFHV